MTATPFFINSARGQLFALYYPPQSGKVDALIIHIPAFAEEMNKSRRMIALQAKNFSHNNYAVLVVDLFGTGDSQGLLEHTNWQTWLDDVDNAVNWLKQQYSDAPLYLWGLRFGSALAASYVAQTSLQIQGLILWQPLLSGKMMLNQFLRLRIASAITNQSAGDQPAETTKSLLQDLANGGSVEVGGYLLASDLAVSINAVDAGQLIFKSPLRIIWLDFVSSQATKPSPVNSKVIEQWNQHDNSIEWTAIHGDRFWSTQEIAVCPELIAATTQALIACK
jgi:exosortase A-associated hydrolase 2